MSEYNDLKMADDPDSSSDSDSSDSSTVSLSEVLKPETFPLQSMDSSSDSSDSSCQPATSYFHIKVKEMKQKRDGIPRSKRWKRSNSDQSFQDIVSSQGKIKFFPEQMKMFLSKEYKNIVPVLSKIEYGTFFIYLARSLIVTLNVDNPRVRVPSSLVFDACIFSENNPIIVLSVFESGKISSRLEMYNTFVARGVTDALRTWSMEGISITNKAVTIVSDLVAEIKRLWKKPGMFHIQASLKMWRDKAEKAAIALLKQVSVASTFPLLYPDKAVSDHVWFLTESEFEFLTNFIDLQGGAKSVTVEGDWMLIQTEIFMRLNKLYRTALFVTSVTSFPQTLQSHIGDSFTSVDEFQKVDASKYELVITDVPIDTKPSVQEKEKDSRNEIFINVAKADRNNQPGVCAIASKMHTIRASDINSKSWSQTAADGISNKLPFLSRLSSSEEPSKIAYRVKSTECIGGVEYLGPLVILSERSPSESPSKDNSKSPKDEMLNQRLHMNTYFYRLLSTVFGIWHRTTV